jgi:site-specific recombinase XerD
MLTNGASLAHVSQLLGHKDVNVTVAFYGAFGDNMLVSARYRHGQQSCYSVGKVLAVSASG